MLSLPFLNLGHKPIIGVVDSGKGGKTLLEPLREVFPDASFIYFGDYDFFPYGEKTTEEIQRRTLTILQDLKTKGVTFTVLACYTSSSCCWPLLDHKNEDFSVFHGFPLWDMISLTEKALKKIQENHQKEDCSLGLTSLGILCTPRTHQEGILQKRLEKILNIPIFSEPCKDLATLAEENNFDLGAEKILETIEKFPQKPSGILYGCTHYPLFHPQVIKKLNSQNILKEKYNNKNKTQNNTKNTQESFNNNDKKQHTFFFFKKSNKK